MAFLKDEIEARVAAYDRWAVRRQFGADGPNERKLWVLACMDERLPVDEALGIRADTPVGGGDAHLFRNAGGIVTDDAIRSAMLTINFFGTKEIVVLQHTGCGMLSANGSDLEKALRDQGIDVDVGLGRAPLGQAVIVDLGQVGLGRWRDDDLHRGSSPSAPACLTRPARSSRPDASYSRPSPRSS